MTMRPIIFLCLFIIIKIKTSAAYDSDTGSIDKHKQYLLSANFLNGLKSAIYKITPTKHLRTRKTGGKPDTMDIIEFKEPNQVEDFLSKICVNGINRIEAAATVLKNKFNLSTDITLLVKNAIALYSKHLKQHILAVAKEDDGSELKKQFIMLDIVDTSNILLHHELKSIFNSLGDDMIAEADNKAVIYYLYKHSIEHKKENIDYLCEKLHVCRSYPSYSDYFGDICTEILKLSDDKIIVFLKALLVSTMNSSNAMSSIMGKRVTRQLTQDLTLLNLAGPQTARETFSVLRGILTHRHKLPQTKSETLQAKTKAVRIILDIIDKAFEVDGQIKVYKLFEDTINAMRNWPLGETDVIFNATQNFLVSTIVTLQNNLDTHTKEEVHTLMEIVLEAKSKNVVMRRKLFDKGSQYIYNQ